MNGTETNWSEERIKELYELPFMELIYQAQSVHRKHFNPNFIEKNVLLSIKTGACPEDCAYCPQSGLYKTGLKPEKLLPIDKILIAAKAAKANGADRFCMGAAWRNLPKKEQPKILDIIKAVKAEGLETCVTLGMLDQEQAIELKQAGLDYYNHNLDTSPEYYKKIITTRTYEQRLQTLQHVRDAGIKVCCGGIMGLGESVIDRIRFLLQLALLPKPPESIPINRLKPFDGTPLADAGKLDDFEFIRIIALARIMFPKSFVRLSCGREDLSKAAQALCFFAGANSIFFGEKLLTSSNTEPSDDQQLFEELGLQTVNS